MPLVDKTLGQGTSHRSLWVFCGICIALLSCRWQWSNRWLLSGTPALTLCLLLGDYNGYRVFPMVPVWVFVGGFNVIYIIAATSWILYAFLLVIVYPATFFICLYQFSFAAGIARRLLRRLSSQLHFVGDTVAFFDIPALEIDVDVEGLMVIRGITISISTLSVVAHGIEVGIKLADDLEIAISTERVDISLFRGIEVSDCYVNVKGGIDEMSFGELGDPDSDSDTGVIVESTPLLLAAGSRRGRRPRYTKGHQSMVEERNMTDSAPGDGWTAIRKIHPSDRDADQEYKRLVRQINDTNLISVCRQSVLREAGDLDSSNDLRAAICSAMQLTATVPHPPERSIKVTSLQTVSSPRTRGFLHRLPFLLRLLLNPIAYLHPVKINSITTGGSGKRISYLLKTHLFKDYAEDNRELRKLEKRMLRWLTDANFVIELSDIRGLASVPIMSYFDIRASLSFGDVIAYRARETDVSLEEVIRLAGADATFSIPSFLLPHHEHILPPIPSASDIAELRGNVADADGKPHHAKAENALKQAEEDETNIQLSTHVQLPASCSQELLNFAATLVKASKIVEIEKEQSARDHGISGIRDLGSTLSKGVKDGVKHAVIAGVINDRWIAKMVGKVVRLMEEAQGDVGWIGDIPVKLAIYRLPEGHPELEKILA